MIGASSTACDDQFKVREATREDAIESLARMMNPVDAFAGKGSVRHLGHTVTWGEVVMRLAADAEAWPEDRMDSIGQNGGDGAHYGNSQGILDSSDSATAPSVSAHYRHSVRVSVTAEDFERGYAIYKLDPYRVCDLYSTGGGPREQMIKKLLRWTDKGHDEDQVLREIGSALDRWHEMRAEDRGVAQ